MLKPPMDLATFEQKAVQVVETLKAIGNARRLMLLCKLVEHGEVTVTDLSRDVDLSQFACSQHLAKVRDEGLVTFRRESQTLWYAIADPSVETLLATLFQLYCKDVDGCFPPVLAQCAPGP
ncbi:MAG: transcriptional regulator [Sphingomonas sp.]|jgi:DNA-binding transcriptional ArsR family regulator|nr:transcriptional regulator [Sphingomonas sp.]